MTHLSRSPRQRSVLFMLLSLLLFAANILLLRGLSMHLPAVDGWIGILFRGAVGLGLLLALFSGKGRLDLPRVFTHPKLVARGVVGANATLLFSITIGFRHLSVAKGSSIQTLLPLLTATGAFVFFGETFSRWELLGAFLTLVATWQFLRSPAPATPAAETTAPVTPALCPSTDP